jgi:hypothetical protein
MQTTKKHVRTRNLLIRIHGENRHGNFFHIFSVIAIETEKIYTKKLFSFNFAQNFQQFKTKMQSARRTITSGNRVREVDLYSGFNKSLMTVYNEANQDDEAYQNAIKVSSYGKRNTTPKTNWVSSKYCGFIETQQIFLLINISQKNLIENLLIEKKFNLKHQTMKIKYFPDWRAIENGRDTRHGHG